MSEVDFREKQVKTHSIKLGRRTGKEQDFYQESQVIALDEHDNVAIRKVKLEENKLDLQYAADRARFLSGQIATINAYINYVWR